MTSEPHTPTFTKLGTTPKKYDFWIQISRQRQNRQIISFLCFESIFCQHSEKKNFLVASISLFREIDLTRQVNQSDWWKNSYRHAEAKGATHHPFGPLHDFGFSPPHACAWFCDPTETVGGTRSIISGRFRPSFGGTRNIVEQKKEPSSQPFAAFIALRLQNTRRESTGDKLYNWLRILRKKMIGIIKRFYSSLRVMYTFFFDKHSTMVYCHM